MKNPQGTKRQLSPEGRANIAAAQKARWAGRHAEKAIQSAVEAATITLPVSSPPKATTTPKDLLRTAVESMEFQRDTLTDRIDTLREVLGQM